MYSLFCTESMLESVFFRNRDKLCKNVGVNGKNCNFLGKMTLFGLMTKKKSSEFFTWKN